MGARNFLKEESVSYFVEDRPWEAYLPAGAKKRLAEAQHDLAQSVRTMKSGKDTHVQDQ